MQTVTPYNDFKSGNVGIASLDGTKMDIKSFWRQYEKNIYSCHSNNIYLGITNDIFLAGDKSFNRRKH